MMCLNHSNNANLANTLDRPWKWTHTVFKCALLIFLLSSASGLELQYPIERDKLVEKDSNNLLSPEFLPFLKDCTSATPTNRALCVTYYDMVYNVYEYGGKADDVKAEIRTANRTLEKLGDTFCTLFPTEVTQALDKRPFLEANHFQLTVLFDIPNYCVINCLTMHESTLQIVIRPICKSISGGCKWILQQKRNAGPVDSELQPMDPKTVDEKSSKVQEKPSVNDSNSHNSIPEGSSKSIDQNVNNNNPGIAKDEGTVNENSKTNVNANIEHLSLIPNLNTSSGLNQKPIPASNVQNSNESNSIRDANPGSNAANLSQNNKPEVMNVSKPVKSGLVQQPAQKNEKTGIDSTAVKNTENRPSTASENKPSQIKDTFTESRDENANDLTNNQNENNVDDNVYKSDLDDTDKQEDDTEQEDLTDDVRDEEHIHEQEVRNDLKNSNNMQSPLLADAAEFREDKESSFFPYFMFLMFFVVTLYVAYHNKSKILALLIEGRRSRNHYSRSGRRKQHSAEYRKLDSNLEEAIQSDGSHMTSSQIIY